MATAASYRTRQPYPTLLERVDQVLVKFDAAFLERRMREHRELQEQLASEGAAEIVHEVVGALECFAEMRAGKGPAKIARLK
jgi:hypothetical protein